MAMPREVSNPLHGTIKKEGQLLSPYLGKDNYYKVTLSKNGISKKERLHRLIAMAFLPNPLNKPFINHINGNKQDNNFENLEWCTAQENIIHAYAIGTRKASIGKRLSKQCKPVICYDVNDNELAIFKSCAIAARMLKIHRPSISEVLRGGQDSFMGYKFKYATDANRD